MALWTYEQGFYQHVLEGTGLEIRTHPVKGKGLFAQKPFRKGETVLEETALCCSQNLDDAVACIPVCAHCLKSLETPRRVVARLAKSRLAARQLPFPSVAAVDRPVRCHFADQGCRVVFCSARCRETAWSAHHAALCRGKMNEPQRAAHDAFMAYEWVQNGVDYSDTAFLALRMVGQTVRAHRMGGQPLPRAFAPYQQLISAPLDAFYFPYLLAASASPSDAETETEPNAPQADTDTAPSTGMKKTYEAFLALKSDPMASPAVKEHYETGRTKDTFCRETVALIAEMLALTPEEAQFLSEPVWSSLLGAVLLNGQERSPPSSYDALARIVRTMGHDQALDAFESELVRGSHVNMDDLYYSTRGQGIYTVGCLFNHTCNPNVEVMYSSVADETLVATTTRDVMEGEELCISYIGTDIPFPQRQQQLSEHYLFVCSCELCEQDAAQLAKL